MTAERRCSRTTGGLHVEYSFGLDHRFVVGTMYVIATCASLLLVGDRLLRWYGVANLAAVAAIGALSLGGVISLWCLWAAVISWVIALHLRRRHASSGARAQLLSLTG